MLMKQEKEILERQARRAGGVKVCVYARGLSWCCQEFTYSSRPARCDVIDDGYLLRGPLTLSGPAA